MRWNSSRPSFGRVTPPEPAHRYRVLAFAAVVLAELTLVVWNRVTGHDLSPLTWYLARSSGITLYLLFWLVVVLGLGLTTSALDRLGGRAVIYSLHRFVTELAYAALGLHMGSLALDRFVPFTALDLLVPFHAMNGDLAVGLGVLSAWGLVIVGISFSLRRWIGYRFWRTLHAAAFPLYIAGLAHGIGAGTDSSSSFVLALYAGTLAVVCFLASYRLLRGKQRGGAPVMPGPAHPSAARYQ